MARGPCLSVAITEKRFPSMAAPLFADFQLTVEPGSIVALHGASGVGKSTLLRLIAGIDADFVGSIRVNADGARQAPPPGFVFQDPRLLPWLTARDNVRAAAPTMTAQAADTALDRVGLSGSANAYPHMLSGGMQRRVALARALACNDRYLLLDEPFVSLDSLLVEGMHQLLSEVFAGSGATVIFTSHHASDAARLADRVIRLEGRPAQLAE